MAPLPQPDQRDQGAADRKPQRLAADAPAATDQQHDTQGASDREQYKH